MKERIRQIMEEAALSQQDFAVRLGISPASLSSIFTGRTNPTNNHVQAVHRAFPDININWLLFGEGEMRTGAASEAVAPDAGNGSSGTETDGDLFSAFAADAAIRTPHVEERMPRHPVSGRDAHMSRPVPGYSLNGEKNIDIIRRKVKEIRVFFDDGTYESFVPSTK